MKLKKSMFIQKNIYIQLIGPSLRSRNLRLFEDIKIHLKVAYQMAPGPHVICNTPQDFLSLIWLPQK